jgi:hypothetical protein
MGKWEVFRGVRLRELDSGFYSKKVGSLPGLDIRFDEGELADFVQSMREFPGLLKISALAAVDKTRLYARRQIVRGLIGIATLKPAYIGRAVSSKKAWFDAEGVEAEIRVASRKTPLGRYAVSPERPPQLKGIAVSARRRLTYKLRHSGKTYGDSPHRVLDNPDEFSSLFVAGMASGHIGVFGRNKYTRDITQATSPSVQYHMYADGFMDEIRDRVSEHFLKTLRSEIAAHGVPLS